MKHIEAGVYKLQQDFAGTFSEVGRVVAVAGTGDEITEHWFLYRREGALGVAYRPPAPSATVAHPRETFKFLRLGDTPSDFTVAGYSSTLSGMDPQYIKASCAAPVGRTATDHPVRAPGDFPPPSASSRGPGGGHCPPSSGDETFQIHLNSALGDFYSIEQNGTVVGYVVVSLATAAGYKTLEDWRLYETTAVSYAAVTASGGSSAGVDAGGYTLIYNRGDGPGSYPTGHVHHQVNALCTDAPTAPGAP